MQPSTLSFPPPTLVHPSRKNRGFDLLTSNLSSPLPRSLFLPLRLGETLCLRRRPLIACHDDSSSPGNRGGKKNKARTPDRRFPVDGTLQLVFKLVGWRGVDRSKSESFILSANVVLFSFSSFSFFFFFLFPRQTELVNLKSGFL